MFGEPDRGADERHLTVDAGLYSQEALFRACYAFTDRCYIFLRAAEGGRVTVVFRKRQSPHTLESLVAEFANELISQQLRRQIATETSAIRNAIVAQAFAEADL